MEGLAKTGRSHCLSLAYIFSPGWSTFSLSNRLPSFSSVFSFQPICLKRPFAPPAQPPSRGIARFNCTDRLLFQGETHTVPPRPTALLFQRQIALKIIYLHACRLMPSTIYVIPSLIEISRN